jgi:hypothetical protein
MSRNRRYFSDWAWARSRSCVPGSGAILALNFSTARRIAALSSGIRRRSGRWARRDGCGLSCVRSVDTDSVSRSPKGRRATAPNPTPEGSSTSTNSVRSPEFRIFEKIKINEWYFLSFGLRYLAIASKHASTECPSISHPPRRSISS